jgi:protein gp37
MKRDFIRERDGREHAPAHMWFGTSVEYGTKLSRIRHLQNAPAAVRFLSIEPLIGRMGALDLRVGCARCGSNASHKA